MARKAKRRVVARKAATKKRASPTVRPNLTANRSWDVVVLGSGNAAMSSALSAAEHGARVLVVERAPKEQRGGNTSFTGGSFRLVYHGLDDIRKLVPDLSDEQAAITDFGEYTAEQYLDDLGRTTQYHTDPDLSEILVRQSFDAVRWLQSKGVRLVPKYGHQAFKHEGRFKFFGGLAIETVGGGRGLVDFEVKAAEKAGVAILYDTQALSLLRDANGVAGVRVLRDGVEQEIRARAVVLACGGFEANRDWRTRYFGPGWDIAKVRGTRYNTGDGIRMALEIGAQPNGQWSGGHATAWERYAPEYGDASLGNAGDRQSYPFSIVINAEGKRFIDEGADFRNYTYAKYGRMVLQQPGSYAWQIFDSQCVPVMRADYKRPNVTKVQASTLEELVDRMGDVDREQFLATVREYNAAIKRDVPFDPNVKDGRCTVGLALNKSNWANSIEVPPFEAYAVTTGITFTYGGLKIDTNARVLNVADVPLRGLYAAGELVGGLFYFNYPGGSGLMAGAVFGRIAGREAAGYARQAA